jgi:RNA polymerase sigma factor (sigma-70 family)
MRKNNKPLIQINPDNESQTDASLWSRLQNGDDKAFEQIYRLYVEDLYRFGKSITGRHELVKDCIQDVFIDLWHYRARLTNNVCIRFYLLRSLSNKIQRQLGQEVKGKKHERNDSFTKEAFQYSIEEEYIGNQEVDFSRQKLDKALAALPVRQKEVIHYVFFEKMSYEEVAQLMGIHIRSAYTLSWKAIKTLKKSFVIIAMMLFFL